jgi:hypothetical protein
VVFYTGPVDYAIGHSRVGEKMQSETVIVVIEVKTSKTFEDAKAQAFAQGATV